jgi:hypothetical protein
MSYTRPTYYPDFCLTGTRTPPPNGEVQTGYQPDQIPPCEEHNYLFGTAGDWIRWLDQITNNPALFPVSNSGHHVATATNLQGQLDQLDAVMSSLGLINEVPAGAVNGSNAQFLLSQAPINTNSVIAFTDGLDSAPAEFSVQQISGSWYVVFASGFIPQTGQKPAVVYMTGSSGVGVGGGVGAIENEPGGIGLYNGNDVNVALLKSLIAGTNVDIVDNGNGTIEISATGGGGGGIETHGSAASPVQIAPSVGITPTTAAEQVWWVVPTSGLLGSQPITASPAIAPGTSVGQRLKLKSTAASGGSGYLIIPNGAGTDQNGVCSMGSYAQTIDYTWDGTAWSEDSRRV